MKNVLLYTDIDFFAGCESMIANFLNSKEFTIKYNPSLLYRKSPNYQNGLVKRINDINRVRPSGIVRISRSQLPSIMINNIAARAFWRFIAIFTKPIVYIYNIAILLKILGKSHREVLIINNGGYPGSTSCLQAAFIARILCFNKVLMVINNAARPTRNILRLFSSFYDRFIFDSINIIVTGSEATKNTLIISKNVPSQKIFVIPNGIDENRFEKNDILFRRNKKFISGQPITITIIGLHEHRKGHLILLKSISKLFKKKQDLNKILKVQVEGEGDLTKSLVNYTEEAGISDIINFMGNIDNISQLYASTDILVVPSLHSEDLPNVISEAMLFGIPSVASKVAGIPSQIKDGENGFLFKPGDINKLSGIIEKILDNSALISVMTSKCVNRFYKKYDKDISTSNYAKLI